MKAEIIVAIVASCSLASFYAGYRWNEPVPVTVSWVPAKIIKGGLQLETRPIAKKDAPKGAIAVGTIKAKPKPVEGSPGTCECQEIAIEFQEMMRDGQPAMEVTSNNAEITGGSYSPIDFKVKPSRPWVIGATYDTEKRIGGFLARDIGPFTIGVQAKSGEAQVTAGLRLF